MGSGRGFGPGIEFTMARLTEAELLVVRGLIEEEPSSLHRPGEYPWQRDRSSYVAALVSQRFVKYESSNGFVNVADTFTEVLKFSSIPDSIEIHVLDFAVEVRFLNVRGGRNESITISAGNFYEPGIVYEAVEARNLVALSVARIQVVGKWVYP